MAEKSPITVMPEKARRFGKKQVLIAAGAVLVLALILGGVWWHDHTTRQTGNTKPGQLSKADLQKSVDKAYATGDYDAAIKTLQAQDGQDPQTQLSLASAYVNKSDYKSALTIYATLDKAGKMTEGYLQGAAAVAEQAKDYQTAIQYYQEAKTKATTAKDTPTWQSNVNYYDTKISELQKKL